MFCDGQPLFFPLTVPFSPQVFIIKTLYILVLWNNSGEIPTDICTLKSLKKFTVSFNLLSHLSSG